MGNPGSTITITLEALTEQANAKLASFFANFNKDLSAGNAAAAASAANTATRTISSVDRAIGQSAAKVNGHVAGMTYYVRSAIDGIRLAAAGGGTRAAFYSLDEAFRGLLASGISLGTLVPVLGAIAAAAGGGYLVWNEWTSATRAAEKAAKDLHDELDGIAKIYTQLKDLQKAQLLSPEAVKRNLDLLTGKIPLYKDPMGKLTTEATTTLPKTSPGFEFGAPMDIPKPGEMEVIQNRKASALEVQKYIQENIAVQGVQDAAMIAAKNKELELREQIHTESLSQIDQEKQKIHEKYQAERDEIDATAILMKGLLTPGQQAQNEKSKTLSLQNEAMEKAALDFKAQQDELQKADAAFAEGKKLTAQTVAEENKKLDDDLTISAAKQGKTREEIYQEEYTKRTLLLTQQLYNDEISQQDYDKAFADAQAKRLVGLKKEQDEWNKFGTIKEQMAQKDYDAEKKSVQSNPFLTDAMRNRQLQAIGSEQIGNVQGQLAKNEAANPTDPAQQIQNLEQRKELQTQLNDLILQQNKLQEESSLSASAAKLALSTMQNLANGVSQSIAGAILQTRNWGDAWFNAMRQAVQGIVQMATQYIATKAAMAAVDAAFTSKSVANSATTTAASGTAGIAKAGEQGGWVGVLIYMGVFLAAMAAMEAIAAGVSGGFKEGGFTGSGPSDQVAGMVHRGEFVIPATRVQQYGLGFFHAIHSGKFSTASANSLGGGDAQAGPGGSVIQHKTQLSLATFGGEADAKRWADSQEGEAWFFDMMNKHAYKYQRT